MKTSSLKLTKFKTKIWNYYKHNKRTLPWRQTSDPYKILASEIMLQQTQVARVLKKYPLFIKRFPTFARLADAPIRKILLVWQGMGYNRRVLYLRQLSRTVTDAYKGKLPREAKILKTFPGIGEATSGSIVAFAFNKPTIFIETNIRRVFIHFFFNKRQIVSDKEIYPLLEKTIDRKNPREWYYALMDYGAMLGATILNPNRKSARYFKQPQFTGSNRQIRGNILTLLAKRGMKKSQLIDLIPDERLQANIDKLTAEGFIAKKRSHYIIR